jgi:large subunit ribosomal protein L25
VADFVIEAQPRTVVGKKVNQLRAQSLVPATIYGPKIEPVSVQIPYRPLQVALMHAGGTNLIDIKVAKDTHTVLAREVQRDVLKGTILHVDFLALDLTVKVTIQVPVVLVGESPAVTGRIGMLLTGANVLQVETMPTHLMNQIEVDISSLAEIGDSVTVADIDLGPDVTILNSPEEMLAHIGQSSAARAEEELEAAAEEGEEASEVEVIQKGKEEEEEF